MPIILSKSQKEGWLEAIYHPVVQSTERVFWAVEAVVDILGNVRPIAADYNMTNESLPSQLCSIADGVAKYGPTKAGHCVGQLEAAVAQRNGNVRLLHVSSECFRPKQIRNSPHVTCPQS